MQELRSKDGTLLASIIRFRPAWDGGQEFFTSPDEQLQVASMRWAAEHTVAMHKHNPVERHLTGTAEVIVVLDGMVRIDVRGDDGEVHSARLGYGDMVIFAPGSEHGLYVLDECRLIEIKQGPYGGQQVDKTLTETENGESVQARVSA